ncbi:MAG: hypothetical protein ABUS56_08425 [Acidobacteriota bacterium]
MSLTSALVVVSAQSSKPALLLVAALPILLFGFIDAYYLGLERRFRSCYEVFVKKLHNGTANVDDAFFVTPKLKVRGLFVEAARAVLSFSIWGFYGGLAAILWFLRSRL